MSSNGSQEQHVRGYRVGSLELLISERTLSREGHTILLSFREFELANVLMLNAGTVVTSARLIESVWKDVVVTENNLARQVANLRKKLGDGPGDEPFIRTAARQGYYIPGAVEILRFGPKTTADAEVPAQDRQRTRKLQTGQILRRWAIGLAALAILAVIASDPNFDERRQKPIPPETILKPLTRNGSPKLGPIVVSRDRIYFRQLIQGGYDTVSIPASGGEPTPADEDLKGYLVLDASADGRRMVFTKPSADGNSDLWVRNAPESTMRLLCARCATGSARFSPDGNLLAVAGPSGITVFDLFKPGRSFNAPVQGASNSVSWSPDSRLIRFDVTVPGLSEASIGELNLGKDDLQSLRSGLGQFDLETGFVVGGWAGRFFLFEGSRNRKRDLWAFSDETGKDRRLAPSALRLDSAPSDQRSPTIGPDETVYLFGALREGELARYDRATKGWVPNPKLTDAYEISYSSDGNWIAYSRISDHTIWRARADGTEALELSLPGLDAHEPHWSSKSTEIAFMAYVDGGLARIYVVEAAGGEAKEVLPGGEQGVPTWAPDGASLMYGDLRRGQPAEKMCIHVLNLRSRSTSTLPNSKGLWSPRCSPDGRYILAVSPDNRELMLRESGGIEFLRKSSRWKRLCNFFYLDDAEWSTDSRAIYFHAKNSKSMDHLYRITIPQGKVEEICDTSAILPFQEDWIGASPSGTVLAVRETYAQEIYSLRFANPK